MDRSAVVASLRNAHARLLEQYSGWGGHNFYGWIVQEDVRNFLGPAILSEADCVYRYALELEREFPGQVHFELSLDQATRADYDREKDRRQRVDLVVSDLKEFVEDGSSMDRFRKMRHTAFIEAKWLKKGWWNENWEGDAFKRADGIAADAERLQRNLELGRCAAAAALVFDDECFFEFHGGTREWPPDVELLLVSPSELNRRGYASAAIDHALEKAEGLASSSERISPVSIPGVQNSE